MNIEIRTEPLTFDLHGIAGDVKDFDFAGVGKRLMDEMWEFVRANDLANKGVNFWVYDRVNYMYTGVELEAVPEDPGPLEHRVIELKKYAYYKHVGPYSGLADVHAGLEQTFAASRMIEIGPRVERYGDWSEDESQLVTEIFVELYF